MNLHDQMTRLAKQAKAASRELAKLTTAEKNACLLAMAAELEQKPMRSTWNSPRTMVFRLRCWIG